MKKRYKVFLPKSLRWFMLPIFAFIWVMVTIAAFVTPGGEEGLGAWIVTSVVLLFVGVLIWMQTSGRWPVYIVEAEEDDRRD